VESGLYRSKRSGTCSVTDAIARSLCPPPIGKAAIKVKNRSPRSEKSQLARRSTISETTGSDSVSSLVSLLGKRSTMLRKLTSFSFDKS
jgi:hypothetical protein